MLERHWGPKGEYDREASLQESVFASRGGRWGHIGTVRAGGPPTCLCWMHKGRVSHAV